ncbi:MAG: LUD domain-containing protein, partial [Pseudomonadota bacterium]
SALAASSALEMVPHLPDLLRGLKITLASPASAQAAQAEVGLTGVHLALVYSGTLVEAGSPEELTASLLPPVHVALIPGKSLVYGVDEALEFYGRRRPERMVFITGPSRTADIELTLVIGVHGPGRVQAVLLDYF